MSADLNKVKGKTAFAYNNKEGLPWHRAGTGVDGAMTSEEAIKLAGLDYTVKKGNIVMKYEQEDFERTGINNRAIKDRYATYRSDTSDIFGLVGGKYEIVQNVKAFEFIDSIVGNGRAIFETAGALGMGETVFITAKLPYYIKINGWDTIENYLVVSNGHDGKTSLNIFLTPVRVVCANTLAAAQSDVKFNINIRHTASIHDKLEDASKILHISKTITEDTERLYKHLTTINVNDKQITDFFNSMVLTGDEMKLLADTGLPYNRIEDISTRKVNIIKGMVTFHNTGIGQDRIIGTAYGLVNGVNGYLTHSKKYINNSKRMESLVLGGSDFKLNNRAVMAALDIHNL